MNAHTEKIMGCLRRSEDALQRAMGRVDGMELGGGALDYVIDQLRRVESELNQAMGLSQSISKELPNATKPKPPAAAR